MDRRERARNECGATAVEYALIVFAVAAVVVAAVVGVGLMTEALFDTTCTSLTSEMGGSC